MNPTAIIATTPAGGASAAAGKAGATGATPGAGVAASASAAGGTDLFSMFLQALGELGIDPSAVVGKGSPTADAGLPAAAGDEKADGGDGKTPTAPSALPDDVAAALAAALAANAQKPGAVAPVVAKTGDGVAADATAQQKTATSLLDGVPCATTAAKGAGTAKAETASEQTSKIADGATPAVPVPAEPAAAAPSTDAAHREAAKQGAANAAPQAATAAKPATTEPLPSERVSSIEHANDAKAAKSDAPAKSATADVEREPVAAATRERAPQHGAEQSFDGGAGQHGTAGHHLATPPTTAASEIAAADASRPAESAIASHATPVARETHTATPAASSAAPLRDVEEVVRLASLRGPSAPRDGGEMRLHVSPEGLGNVEVRVSVHQDGVHATLLADQDHARQALQSSRSSLEAALQRSSLKLEGFTVDVGSQHQQQSQGRQQPSPAQVFSKWFGPASPAAAVAPVAAVATPSASAHGGALSLRA